MDNRGDGMPVAYKIYFILFDWVRGVLLFFLVVADGFVDITGTVAHYHGFVFVDAKNFGNEIAVCFQLEIKNYILECEQQD